MEVDKNLAETINKDIPRVPIKTYQWEDVRRSRKKGGYPWTHISKPPYDGQEDPEEYTLENYRRSRSRSVSTYGDRSPSPYNCGNRESFSHSRTPSTTKVEHLSSNRNNHIPSSSHSVFQTDEITNVTFESRYERSLSPQTESINNDKFERSQSLRRDFTSKDFQRSKSPSRSFSEKKSESPTTQRRSRSPRAEAPETINCINSKNPEEKFTMDIDEEQKESVEEETDQPETDEKTLDEISLSPESETVEEGKSSLKDSRSRCQERADSKRKLKRRLSVQSSYSRISLTKQSILDRIKSTKKSLKASRMVKRSKSDVTHEKKPVNTKGRKSVDTTKYPEKPVYIHIPLKPPPGQTDEFSYLEFDENAPPVGQKVEKKNGRKEVFGDDRDGSPIVGVILEYDVSDDREKTPSKEINDIISKMGNGASIQQIDAKDIFPEIAKQSDKIKEIVESIEDRGKIVATDGKDILEEVEISNREEALKKLKQFENGSIKQEKQSTDNENVLDTMSELKEKSDSQDEFKIQEISNDDEIESQLKINNKLLLNKPVVTEPDEDNISQYLDHDESVAETPSSRTESAEPIENANKSDENGLPLKEKCLEIPNNRKQRSRSEEPPVRKRKLSIESSYSRKSLSKLAFIKKFKNFTDKLKLPPFKKQARAKERIDPVNTSQDETNSKEVTKEKIKKSNNLKSPNNVEPQYIYIPLKPPEGETDEFSKYVAEENTQKSDVSGNLLQRKDTNGSEESPTDDVHIIILTPPSDDEILDPNYPDTPSESGPKFFDNMQIDNLKHLAKKIVNEVYPDSLPLQTVQEEKSNADEQLLKEVETKDLTPTPEQVKIENKGIEEINMKNEIQFKNKYEKENIDSVSSKINEGEIVMVEEQMIVDEEDGLKVQAVSVSTINDEQPKVPQSIMSSDKSPTDDANKTKKKVLFKNKKKTDDGEYEYINIPDSKRSSLANESEEDLKTFQIKEDVQLSEKEEITKSDENKWSEIETNLVC